MKVKGFVKCFFSRECIIDPSESIVSEIMKDKRNFLCKCHRCGLYVMHDGAISGLTSRFMSERKAFSVKRELESTFSTIKKQESKEIGKWVEDEYGISRCSECNCINNTFYRNYCPNCGARME